MVTEGTAEPQAGSEKNWNPAAGTADRLTVVLAVTLAGMPAASCDCTVTTPEQTPAPTVCGEVMNASWVGVPPEGTTTPEPAMRATKPSWLPPKLGSNPPTMGKSVESV